jgi:formate dehydrogenase assembly factor FdhD
MTSEDCISFIERHGWLELRLPDENNVALTAGYLRNNGVIARISKAAPVSMFRIGQGASLWVVKEQEQMAARLIQELRERFTQCSQCGHVLLVEEEHCSYCDEE